jgi:hypothetical protein
VLKIQKLNSSEGEYVSSFQMPSAALNLCLDCFAEKLSCRPPKVCCYHTGASATETSGGSEDGQPPFDAKPHEFYFLTQINLFNF